MKPSVTPLRYPGGKAWLIPYVKRFIEYHKIPAGIVVEPFAGSASITVGLLRSNLMRTGIICEKDPLIVAFWESVLKHNEELCQSVSNLNVNMETWWNFKKYLDPSSTHKFSSVDLATAFIFYNRTNYSGIIKAGPIGGKSQLSKYNISCRFNKSRVIQRIRQIGLLRDRLIVVPGDGIKLIKKYSDIEGSEDLFFYIDPPYYRAGKVLYRDYFSNSDHNELANAVRSLKSPWLISYDESDFIRGLYLGAQSDLVYTDYQAGHLRRGVREMLFSNRKIPPPEETAEKNKSESKPVPIELYVFPCLG